MGVYIFSYGFFMWVDRVEEFRVLIVDGREVYGGSVEVRLMVRYFFMVFFFRWFVVFFKLFRKLGCVGRWEERSRSGGLVVYFAI